MIATCFACGLNDLTRRRLFEEMKRDWQIFKAKYSHMEEYAALLKGEAA